MKRLRHVFPLLVATAAAFLSSPGSGRETPHLGRIIDLSETPMVDGVGPIGASLDTMPFYHEGTWHLFHLQNGMAIAHRTSKDLVQWKIEPIALWQGDPYVFYNDRDECWWLLVCTQTPGDFHQRSGCVGLAKSKNLRDWRLADPLWKWNSAMHADCPQVFKEGDFWYLFTLDCNSRYRIADSPFGPWRRPPRRELMLTPLFAISRPASDGKRWVTFPFICGRHGENDFADLINAEVLAIPRQLDFHKDTKRYRARDPGADRGDSRKAGPGGGDSCVGETAYRRLDRRRVGSRLQGSRRATSSTCRECRRASIWRWTSYPPPVGRPFKVRLFVSGTVMEVFIDDVLSLCHRVYAHSFGDVFLETRDGRGTFSNIKTRKLQSDVKLERTNGKNDPMIRFSRLFLPLFVVVISLATLPSNSPAGLTFSCGEDSDIYQLVKATEHDASRFETAAEAIAKAPERSGVLVLASDYPNTPTPITEADYQLAAEKKLRLYVEFPEIVPGVEMGNPQLTAIGPYGSVLERIVVTDDFFGDALKPMRIMAFYDCYFRPVTSDRGKIETHLVATRVVGHDTAVLGLPETTWPILFRVPRTDVLVSTTTFSPCVRARFMPIAAWKTVINRILKWLDPAVSEVAWTPTVRPTYSKDEALPKGAREKAIRRATQWFVDSKLLLDQDGMEFVYNTPNPQGTLPFPENWKGAGDGSLGLIECYIGKRIYLDGRQPCNPCIRADCNGEASMALCLGGQFVNDPEKPAIAKRILDFVYFESDMAGGPRSEPGNPAFGMLSHNTKSPGQYYSDDHARALLGTIAAAAVLESDLWDEAMCRTILANFRVTNTDGYDGGGFIDDGTLQSGGWEPFWFRGGHVYSPHYQAYIWATFLWLYDKTGYEPLLDRARNGISTMMKAYPDRWIAECGRMDEELCHMLLPLAYLIRVEDKPEYRAWLRCLVDVIIANTDVCGAIPQRVTVPYSSNMQYGTGEAPIVYQTGDPGTDLLYTMNFGFSGLHEASFILDDPKLDDALDRIEDFLIRIQTSSQAHPELSGTWYRAFDFNHWEYWGSDGEIGWCMLSTETGWTHSWITGTLVLRQRNESLWDLTKKSDIKTVFEPLRKHMVPEELFKAKTLEEYRALKAASK